MESVAAVAAQARVPKGKIEGVELERENGKLMYSTTSRRRERVASMKCTSTQ